jgi:hypothetical protein
MIIFFGSQCCAQGHGTHICSVCYTAVTTGSEYVLIGRVHATLIAGIVSALGLLGLQGDFLLRFVSHLIIVYPRATTPALWFTAALQYPITQ